MSLFILPTFLLLVILSPLESCIDILPGLNNSNTTCLNGTGSCTLSCNPNYIYFDGNRTKTYSCDNNNIWSPPVPTAGCLDQIRATFWILFEVEYQTTQVAAYCIQAHRQALVDKQNILIEQVSFYCNNALVSVGNISINKTTSSTSSFTITTVFELEIGDASTTESNKAACASLLKLNVNSAKLLVYGNTLECTYGQSNITKQSASVRSDLSRCPPTRVLVVDSKNDDYCVPDVPVVGVNAFTYSTNISQDILLNCVILFRTNVTSVYWQHDSQNLTYLNNNKYEGGTVSAPSLKIRNVTYDDAGKYTCHTVGNNGSGSSPVIVFNVLARSEDKPSVHVEQNSYNVTAGNNITLVCIVSDFPAVNKVVWIRNVSGITEVVIPDQIKFSGSNSTYPSLTLLFTDLNDTGVYTCTATNVAGTGKSLSTSLQVLGDIPKVDTQHDNSTVIVGENVTINCTYSSIPVANNVQWIYNGSGGMFKIDKKDNRYSGSNLSYPSLTITNASFNDAGDYTCTVKNYLGTGVSSPVLLKVKGDLPIVDAYPSIFSVILGENITMNCNFTGVPNPLFVSWIRNATLKLTVLTSILSNKYHGGTLQTPSLTITNVQNEDEGVYICSVTNLVGTSYSKLVYLNVTGDIPIVTIKLPVYTVIFGDNITIGCSVTSHPAYTSVQWQLNTTRGPIDIEVGGRAYQGGTTNQQELNIINANFSIIGMYRCTASNQVGTGYSNFTFLNVVGDIPNVYAAQTSYTVIVTDNVTMACNVSGTPKVTGVSWSRNSTNGIKVVNMTDARFGGATRDLPHLLISNVKKSDEGWYICTAENIIGVSVSEQIYLNVTGELPVVEIPKQSYEVILGDNITIPCQIRSHPTTTSVMWERNITGVVTRVTIDNLTYSGSSITEPSITITGVMFRDRGEYVCVATNFVGKTRSNATVLTVIGGLPYVFVKSLQYNVTEESNITLLCNATGTPKVSAVLWTFNITAVSISSERFIASTPDAPSLTIINTRLDDTGWYTCTASNLAGTTNGPSVMLRVSEKCTKYVPGVSNANLDCTYSNGIGICTMVCKTDYIFRDGSSSKVYSCTGRKAWSPALPMPTCLETAPSTFILTITITYTTSAIAVYCKTTHDIAVLDNYNKSIQQLSIYCNNEFVSVGPIVINSTNSSTSSFDISTTYFVIIGSPSTSKANKDACASLIQNNILRPELLVYGNSLQCENRSSTITKNNGKFTAQEAKCPVGFILIDGTSTCVSEIPRIGATDSSYKVGVGDNVTLYCNVTSELALLSVNWQFTAYGTTTSIVIPVGSYNRYSGGTPTYESLIIRNATYSDAGNYKCTATNMAGMGTGPDIQLDIITVVQDLPYTVIPKVAYDVILGNNVTLECRITSYLVITKVLWQKNLNGSLTNITVDGTLFYGSTPANPSLTLTKVRFIDAGNYVCVAANYAGSSSSNVTSLKVNGDKPIVSINSTVYTVQFGGNITLHCSITGSPVITEVAWYLNNSESSVKINGSLNHYLGASVVNPALTILMATMVDKGWYTCAGINLVGVGTSQQIYLNVTANKPVLTTPLNRYSAMAGQNVTLQCNVVAYPEVLSSSWSRNTTDGFKQVFSDGIKFSFVNKSVLSLTISSLQLNDTGAYICQSTNEAGTTYGSPILLNVVGGLPRVNLNPTHSVLYGDSVTLECVIIATPDLLSVAWQTDISGIFSYINIDNSKYHGGSLANKSLIVSSVTFRDAGKYKCIGSNFLGMESNVTTLTVNGGVPSVYIASSIYHVSITDNVTMFCNFSGSPNVLSIKWQTNTTGLSDNRHTGGTLNSPSLTIYNVNVKDGGWYMCTASNIVGTGISNRLYLNVTGEDICSASVFPTLRYAVTSCSDTSELICVVTCNSGFVTRAGNMTVYFKCENNLWKPSLPPQGCIAFVLPFEELNIQMTYEITTVAVWCLSSHDAVIQSMLSSFAQQATSICNNDAVHVGNLEISDFNSSTSSFTIITTFTLRTKYNNASKTDRVVCEIILNHKVKTSPIFTYSNMLMCGSTSGTVSKSVGTLSSTTEICPGGTTKVVTSQETFCVSDIPSVVISKPSYTVEKGESLSVDCNVDSNIDVMGVYWLHNASGIVTAIYGNKTTKYMGSTPAVPSLTVLNADFSDIGSYTCVAYNSMGSGSSAAVIVNVIERVRDLPVITSTSTNVQYTPGSTAKLDCVVNDKSEPSLIFWQQNKNGVLQILQPFTFAGRYTGSTTLSPGLVISNVVEGDTGNYTCHAVNILGVGYGHPIQLTVKGTGSGSGEDPLIGRSVSTNNLTCVKTFGFLMVFAVTGILSLTIFAVMMSSFLPSDHSFILQIRQWKVSDKIIIILVEVCLSVVTSIAITGIITIEECSNNMTGATTALTSIAIIPGIILAAIYLVFCCYIQIKRIQKIAVTSDTTAMIPSTSPVPDEHRKIKSWRSYEPSELPIDENDEKGRQEINAETSYQTRETDVYASTFKSQPLIAQPLTPRRKALPPIDYMEYSDERRNRRKKKRKKRKMETFDGMNESTE